MKTYEKGNRLSVEILDGNRLPSETALAYEYFKLYRDMPPKERSLRDLCEREVNGKKRSISQMGRWSKEEHSLRALCHLEVTGKKRSERVFKRWSSEHNWQERVATYAAEVERAAYRELLAQRKVGNTSVTSFILGFAV